MSVRRGEAWGREAGGPPDLVVGGSDTDLSRALSGAQAGVLVRFDPSPAGSDLAAAVGLHTGAPTAGHALPLDALRLAGGDLAVNGIVAGVPPDRLRRWHRRRPVEVEIDGVLGEFEASTVVVMNGQFLRGADVSPRGHPGDGSCEVQIYALAPGERGAMRARLSSGAHLPHPRITTRRGRRVAVRFPRPVPIEKDGHREGRASVIEIEVIPGAYRLLV
jgi:hypothetical protein